ncbi:MAG: imidazole glycerol phosphate synthase subunit HisH [Akkermansiaceae bacterium]|nr:imidazole glycerol phosphate synthase subunit HisH [Akkermansiaceae bacterium]
MSAGTPVNEPSVRAAIVDYGLGNLFSVLHACRHSGIDAFITSSPKEIEAAEAVILPGVGAFADAMECLNRLDLSQPLRDYSQSGKPLFGICLGLQLLFSESEEFGSTKGLGIVPGSVKRLHDMTGADGRRLKIPHVGWNLAVPPGGNAARWQGTPLEDIGTEAMMYFVHSFYVTPEDEQIILSKTTYGDQEFCSSIHKDRTFAFQFHPERSGEQGIQFYRKIREIISNSPSTIS